MTSVETKSGIGLPPKPIDFRRILTYFLAKKDPHKVSDVDKLLAKYIGKEHKLMLMLAKKYDSSNPLNRVFVDRVTDDHYGGDHVALTRLYLSIFYPQDVEQAEALCEKYEDKEKLFKKLAANFHAINPLTMNRKNKTEESLCAEPIDYKGVLTAFYKEHDAEKMADDNIEDVLSKCKGKEAILFSVFALKYNTSNALNAVFEDRLKDMECKDHLSLLKLYLSVFHPSCHSDAKSMLSKYQGKEGELFSKLSSKFRACNPMEVCSKLGKTLLESIDESKEEKTNPAVIQDGCASPKRRASAASIPQSPAVTP